MKVRDLSAAVAIAGLACVTALAVASAANAPGPSAATVQAGAQQPIRLADTVTTQAQSAKKKHLKVEHPKTNWLNPQPEPPMAGKKPAQGDTWLNPQPEPPRPVTTKKLH